MPKKIEPQTHTPTPNKKQCILHATQCSQYAADVTLLLFYTIDLGSYGERCAVLES